MYVLLCLDVYVVLGMYVLLGDLPLGLKLVYVVLGMLITYIKLSLS